MTPDQIETVPIIVIGLITGLGLFGYATWEVKSGKAVYRTRKPYVIKSEEPSLYWSAVFLHYFLSLAFLSVPFLTRYSKYSPRSQSPIGDTNPRSQTAIPESRLAANLEGACPRNAPNPPLNSDPARIAFRSFSSFRFLGFVHRLGAGGAG
jgi:hypothetical protein